MTAPADRLLEVLADPVALQIVRGLAEADQTQAELVASQRIGQSIASRTLKMLRTAGLVEAESKRGAIRLSAPEEVRGLLLAADRLAEALLVIDTDAQDRLSSRTRRAVVRPTQVGTATPDKQQGGR